MANTANKAAVPVPEAVQAESESATVRIKLPIVKGVNEDKVVWINNTRYLIKRGVAVDVPRAVALVLEQQEDMERERYEYESQAASE